MIVLQNYSHTGAKISDTQHVSYAKNDFCIWDHMVQLAVWLKWTLQLFPCHHIFQKITIHLDMLYCLSLPLLFFHIFTSGVFWVPLGHCLGQAVLGHASSWHDMGPCCLFLGRGSTHDCPCVLKFQKISKWRLESMTSPYPSPSLNYLC